MWKHVGTHLASALLVVGAMGSPQDGDGLDGIPKVLRAAAVLGVPAVIALFLTWFLTQGIDRQLAKTVELINMHINQQTRSEDRILYYLQAICLNSADTEQKRAICGPRPWKP